MSDRPEFREWIDQQNDSDCKHLPLTHVTKGIIANDIIREDGIDTRYCKNFEVNLAYMFYGRPAYRITGDGPIQKASSCPFCFIFSPELIEQAYKIYPFDTGAYKARLYKHSIMDEMNPNDFEIILSKSHPQKLIKTVFDNNNNYISGNVTVDENSIEEWNFLAQSYISLLTSKGRNEPDDRVGSFETIFNKKIELTGNLISVIVPHTVWDEKSKAPWLLRLSEKGTDIITYHFSPGRSSDYYYALLEIEVTNLYKNRGYL